MATDFFSLPPELRNMVYKLAFEADRYIVSAGGKEKVVAWTEKPKSMHMLLVSRKLGLEAGSLLFKKYLYWYKPKDFSLLPNLSMSAKRYSPESPWCLNINKIDSSQQSCSKVFRDIGLDSSAPWKSIPSTLSGTHTMELRDKGGRFTIRAYQRDHWGETIFVISRYISAMLWTGSKPYKLLNTWTDQTNVDCWH